MGQRGDSVTGSVRLLAELVRLQVAGPGQRRVRLVARTLHAAAGPSRPALFRQQQATRRLRGLGTSAAAPVPVVARGSFRFFTAAAANQLPTPEAQTVTLAYTGGLSVLTESLTVLTESFTIVSRDSLRGRSSRIHEHFGLRSCLVLGGVHVVLVGRRALGWTASPLVVVRRRPHLEFVTLCSSVGRGAVSARVFLAVVGQAELPGVPVVGGEHGGHALLHGVVRPRLRNRRRGRQRRVTCVPYDAVARSLTLRDDVFVNRIVVVVVVDVVGGVVDR